MISLDIFETPHFLILDVQKPNVTFDFLGTHIFHIFLLSNQSHLVVE